MIVWASPEKGKVNVNVDNSCYWSERIDATVGDYRIGWVTIHYYQGPAQVGNTVERVQASSAVSKSSKCEACYCESKDHKKIMEEAARGTNDTIKAWVENHWHQMLTKAGLVYKH
jgi:hypothetical protein